MKRGSVIVLNQMIKSLEEAGVKLEQSYKSQNVNDFEKSKKLILQLQKQINEVLQ